MVSLPHHRHADQTDSPAGRLSGTEAPAAKAVLNEQKRNLSQLDEKREGKTGTAAAGTAASVFDMFADEVELGDHAAPGTMALGAMASENHALVDNWDDAEGYYREYWSSPNLCLVAYVCWSTTCS